VVMELVPCPACGTQNAAYRFACLKCGVELFNPTGADLPIDDKSKPPDFRITEEVPGKPPTEPLQHHTRGLKLGEVILLWAGGLWTAFVIIVAFFAWAISSDGKPSHYLFGTFAFTLPIWIMCGLIWVTIYGRARKNPQPPSVKTNLQPTTIRKILEIARNTRREIREDIFVALMSAIVLALPVAAVIWLVDLAHRPIGEWVNLPTLEEAFPSFRRLFHGEWKFAGWTIYEHMVGWFLFFFLWCLFYLWAYKFYEWVNWVVLQRHKCSYCYQWRKDEEAAHECCRSLPPTRTWFKRHKLTTKRDLWKYGTYLFLFAPLFALFLATLFASFSWHFSWVNATLGVYGVDGVYFYMYVYRPHRNQKPCSGCGVRADNRTNRTGLPLCSRCYAKEP